MNENVQKLLELIKEHPDLPIVPMVDSEVVADDYCSYWMGHWGHCQVSEYLLGEERIWFKDADPEDVISDVKGYEFWENLPDEKVDAEFDALGWIKCIAVYITT